MKQFKKIFTRIAVVVFILAIVFALVFATVPSFRVQILNFLLTFDKDYTAIKLGEDGGNTNAGFRNTYAPTYIPEGFWIKEISNMGESKIITYINDEGEYIDFWDLDLSMTANIDTENADIIKSIAINGEDGIFVLKKEGISISWSNNEKIFIITAYISEDEIIKIAESVKFIKLEENSDNITTGFRNTYAPTYIPAGYWIYEISDMDESKTITYINDEEKYIGFYEWDSSVTTNVDTKNADIIKSITINGNEGLFVLKNEKITISWSNDEKIFIITARISEEEAIKMAKSVKFIK